MDGSLSSDVSSARCANITGFGTNSAWNGDMTSSSLGLISNTFSGILTLVDCGFVGIGRRMVRDSCSILTPKVCLKDERVLVFEEFFAASY